MFRESYAEFLLAKDLIHPNIVEHKYFLKSHVGKNYEYHMIMEFMDGKDMLAYLKDEELGVPEDIHTVQGVGAQLLSAIKYLHANNIVHQDLKPQNIVFSKDYETVKLIDLGISGRLYD